MKQPSFERLAAGAVRTEWDDKEFIFTPSEWCAIVAQVGRESCTPQHAEKLHGTTGVDILADLRRQE